MLSPPARQVNVAIVGIGNCASSLVQGLQHYGAGANDRSGLMHWEIGGYRPSARLGVDPERQLMAPLLDLYRTVQAGG